MPRKRTTPRPEAILKDDCLARNISKTAIWFGVGKRVNPGQVDYCNKNVEALLLAAGKIESMSDPVFKETDLDG